jgi:hypothetical protein
MRKFVLRVDEGDLERVHLHSRVKAVENLQRIARTYFAPSATVTDVCDQPGDRVNYEPGHIEILPADTLPQRHPVQTFALWALVAGATALIVHGCGANLQLTTGCAVLAGVFASTKLEVVRG